ncbi:MAG: hypothetical protein K5866_05240 [Treponema sp.]|nr:hypothetical protein [Treponema sp.]
MKKTFIVSSLLIMSALAGNLWADTVDSKLKSLVNEKYYQELIKNEVVTIYKDDASNVLELIPESAYSEKIKANLIKKADKNYPFTYEALYYKNKSDLLKTSNSSKTDISIDDISRVCRSVSKMQGMTYYSTTRKKEMVLYDRTYMIDGPDGDKIPDQNTGNADGQLSYCFQNDSSFGECRYKLNYYQSENEMMAAFSNIDTLGLGPFKAIYPGCMTINILVRDLGEKVLVYICCDLDSIKFPGIKGQITDSISSRMVAVYNWFIKQF